MIWTWCEEYKKRKERKN